MTFHVGQKVVCVDDSNNGTWAMWRPVISFPTRGQVYTIRDIAPPYNTNKGNGGFCLRLSEISNQPIFDGVEPNFFASRFRHVVERKTSIAVFEALLVQQREVLGQ